MIWLCFFLSAQNHLMAVTKSKLAPLRPMKKIIEDSYDKDDDVMVNYLKVSYHMAKREMPKEEFEYFIRLVDDLGVKTIKEYKNPDDLSEITFPYTSDYSVSDFQSACAQVVLDDVLSEISSSQVYSLMIDESTDRANKKQLLAYVQYFHEKKLKTNLLENIEITTAKADAETITSKILTELNIKGLDIRKMVGIGTDGASVMTGRKSGVVVRLREHTPSLVGIHCAAHRCALAASQAAKQIPQLKEYLRTLTNIFDYFSGSALRSNKLREIQLLLELPTLKYAQVHSVRWLSMEKAVEVVYRTYPALVVALEHEATSNPAAKGLYQQVSQYSFIAITHMLMDILPFLGKLSKVFQNESIDFSKIQPVVDSTCEALEDLIECEGAFVGKLCFFIESENDEVRYKQPVSESTKAVITEEIALNIDGFEGNFCDSDCSNSETDNGGNGVQVKYYPQQKNILATLMPTYVNKIVENLQDRFQDSGIVEKMKVVLPAKISQEPKNDLAKYGVTEVIELAEHFKDQNINKDEVQVEYRQYKRLVLASYKSDTLETLCGTLNESYNDVMPNMAKLLKCCVVIPVSSVPCERGFSTQNRIKSRFRTTMVSSTLNDLMRLSESGPDRENFDFGRALTVWKNAKKRKFYNRASPFNTRL